MANYPKSQPLVKDCHFGLSQVNYSDLFGLVVRCTVKVMTSQSTVPIQAQTI